MFSMTGFGESRLELDQGELIVEIKSVNNRYKDIRFRTSLKLSKLEIDLRKKIQNHFKRGSFDIFISLNKNKTELSESSLFDAQKVKNFISEVKRVALDNQTELQISAATLLKPEFQAAQEDDFLSAPLLRCFDQAIEGLKQARKTEGEAIKQKLASHFSKLQDYHSQIREHSQFKEKVKTRLQNSFSELNLPIESSRLDQEIIYYLEKLTIDEELDRLDVHFKRFESMLKSGEDVGRKIDFTLQEVNREVNTIGSKSQLSEISEAVISMKYELEKIREQALNIE